LSNGCAGSWNLSSPSRKHGRSWRVINGWRLKGLGTGRSASLKFTGPTGPPWLSWSAAGLMLLLLEQGKQLVLGHRATDQIALDAVAAHVAQDLQVLVGFHPFRHHAHVE